MNTFHLTIITPAGTAYENKVVSLIAPAENGYLGVLRNHAPMLTLLKPGKLNIREETGREVLLRIDAGYLQVEKNRVTVLTKEVKGEGE
jgi:F-type H+-transporting ATPase subunit epsilon